MRSSEIADVDDAVAHRVALDGSDPAAAIRRFAPDGVHRIVEVSLSDNADLDAAVAAPEAVIAAYATRSPRPDFDFWSTLFANLTIRLLGSDDFPPAAKRQAAADLTAAGKRARFASQSTTRCHWSASRRHTTASTQVLAAAS